MVKHQGDDTFKPDQ